MASYDFRIRSSTNATLAKYVGYRVPKKDIKHWCVYAIIKNSDEIIIDHILPYTKVILNGFPAPNMIEKKNVIEEIGETLKLQNCCKPKENTILTNHKQMISHH